VVTAGLTLRRAGWLAHTLIFSHRFSAGVNNGACEFY